MAGQAEELETMATRFDTERFGIEEELRRLMGQAENDVVLAPLGWKGPSADRFWSDSQERQSQLRTALDRLSRMSEQMRLAARRIREAEAQSGGQRA